jgi:hypothetical protein
MIGNRDSMRRGVMPRCRTAPGSVSGLQVEASLAERTPSALGEWLSRIR